MATIKNSEMFSDVTLEVWRGHGMFAGIGGLKDGWEPFLTRHRVMRGNVERVQASYKEDVESFASHGLDTRWVVRPVSDGPGQ